MIPPNRYVITRDNHGRAPDCAYALPLETPQQSRLDSSRHGATIVTTFEYPI
jgi:hypothetical protein